MDYVLWIIGGGLSYESVYHVCRHTYTMCIVYTCNRGYQTATCYKALTGLNIYLAPSELRYDTLVLPPVSPGVIHIRLFQSLVKRKKLVG
jgi:hypothetical protein